MRLKYRKKYQAVILFIAFCLLTGCNDGRKKESVEVMMTQNGESESVSHSDDSTVQIIENEEETEEVLESVSFLFAGDLCLEEDGFVLDYYDERGGNLSNCMSPYLLERMQDADIFMINHEYTVSERGSRLNKYYTFRANPSRMSILKEMSVDIVSLANNHSYDYGFDAFVDTIDLLKKNGIACVGAGMNEKEAEEVFYFDIKGIRIGVVAASSAEKNIITPQATETEPGIFYMYDATRLKEVSREAAKKCDFLVAYLHWGTENSKYYMDYQHDIAQELVDCGVDAIIGGHPHVIQGMEFIGDVPVVYSLGDFWFNGEDKYSMMIQLNIKKDGSCVVEIIPCRQRDYGIHYIEETEAKSAFFDYFSNLSNGVLFG